MRATTLLLLAPLTLLLAASTADAKSCSTFAVIKSYDADTSKVVLDIESGDSRKFFPKPEGAPNTSKVPGKCKRRVLKQDGGFEVKARGGRLSITQIRENFSGNMLNDADDETWVPNKIQALIKDKTKVVVVLRPEMGEKGRDVPHWVSTIYMPITDKELKEIDRLNAQAEDVD
jgi:hypothetical protein